jgi:hypothetical protein
MWVVRSKNRQMYRSKIFCSHIYMYTYDMCARACTYYFNIILYTSIILIRVMFSRRHRIDFFFFSVWVL